MEGGKEWTVWHTELSGLAKLCRAKGTRLIFLFLPYRANQRPSPKFIRYLETMGRVYDLPREIMAHKRYWRDKGHLTPEGSRAPERLFHPAGEGRIGLSGGPSRLWHNMPNDLIFKNNMGYFRIMTDGPQAP